MGETLEYSAELIDQITPVLQSLIEALNNLALVMKDVAEQLTAGFDEGASGVQVFADVLQETNADVDMFSVSIEETTNILIEQTDVIIQNTDSTAENTAAKTENADANAAMGDSSQKGATDLLGLGMVAGMASAYLFKMGLDSDTALTRVMALAVGSNQGADQIRASLQQMAIDVGTSTTDLANGLYDVVSAGYSTADSLTILHSAAELAAIGGTDLHTVTNGLSAIMKMYNIDASQAANVTGLLLQGVKDGKSSFQDYSNAIGLVSNTAHSAGFSLNEAAAALSTLTIVFPDARRAGMDLQNLLRAIGIDSQKVGDTARKMGLAFDQTAFDSDNLQQKLQYLQQITGGNQAEMLKLTGGAAGYAAAQVLLNNNMSDYSRILGDVGNSQSTLANAWETHEGSISAHIDHMGGALSALADKLTQLAKPAINTILDALAGIFEALGTAIEQHGDIIIPILATLAAIVGGILVGALYSLAAAAGTAIAAVLPIALPIAAIAGGAVLLAMAFKHFYDSSAPFRAAIDNLRNAFSGLMNPVTAFQQVLANPQIQTGLTYIRASAETLANVLESGLMMAVRNLADLFRNGIVPALQQVEPHIINLAGVLTQTLIPGILNVVTDVSKGANSLGQSLVPVIEKILPLVSQLAGFIADQLGKAIKAIMPDVEKAGQTVGQFAKDLGERLGPAINNIVGFIQNVLLPIWKAAWPGIESVFVGVWNVIKGVFEVAWNLISGLIKVGLDIIGGNWGQAWTDIKDMFAGIWQGILDILGGLAGIIGGYLQEALGVVLMIWGHIWDWVKQKVGDAWNWVTGKIHDAGTWIGQRFTDIKNTITTIWTNIWNWVTGAVSGAVNTVVGWFSWLYQHNTYFQELVDMIRTAIAAGITWLKGVWTEVSGWLVQTWDAIKKAAGDAWNWVKDHIIQPISDAWNWVTGKINDLKNWLVARWNDIANDAKQLWTGFTNAISSTWNNVTGWIHDHIVQPISDTIGKLISDALNWGANLVHMLQQGIQNAWGDFMNWLKGTVGGIGKFLGFHSPPPEGPLSDSDTWMPNMIQMFTEGITRNAGKLVEAASSTADLVNQNMQLAPGLLTPGAIGAGTLGGRALPPYGSSGGVGPANGQYITITLNGGLGAGLQLLNPGDRSRLMQQIAQYMGQQVNLQTKTVTGYAGA